ncbi:G-protein coupled receptor Mth-like [Homalodisca vitripennis]|uniref:G-protein coupled receptor Mth-like n=1 Tax=Homalodisca vitripennis TaxID=197043 RepID=UPI001EECC25B|nr:G-protein coupled receptor Mth-like [Homalodisca vitripennis]
MPSVFIQKCFTYIKNCSWKCYFISVLLFVDLLANWYLYGRHPPVPGIKQRCSTMYPEFAMVLENPVSLPNRRIQEEDGTIYSPGHFWYDKNNYRGCPCNVRPCVRKCCAFSDVFDKNYKCMPSQANVSDFINSFREVYRMNVSKDYFSVLSKKCEMESSLQNVTLLMDGRISSPSGYFDQSQYCLERSSGSLIAVSCVEDSFAKTLQAARSMLTHTLRVVPTSIHVITLILYIVLPNLRCGVGCLMVNLVAAMILKGVFNLVIVADLGHRYRLLCTSIGLAMQYSWLSCQAWQLVIAYQIWTSFRPTTLRTLSKTRSMVRSKLRLYQGVAWGLPFLLSAFTLIVDLASFIPSSLKPHMGLKRCWFSSMV